MGNRGSRTDGGDQAATEDGSVPGTGWRTEQGESTPDGRQTHFGLPNALSSHAYSHGQTKAHPHAQTRPPDQFSNDHPQSHTQNLQFSATSGTRSGLATGDGVAPPQQQQQQQICEDDNQDLAGPGTDSYEAGDLSLEALWSDWPVQSAVMSAQGQGLSMFVSTFTAEMLV